MRKIVMLKPDVSPSALRNVETGKKPDPLYFNLHIKNKELTLCWALKYEGCVRDEDGEWWEVERKDLTDQLQYNTVGEEQMQGRRASA